MAVGAGINLRAVLGDCNVWLWNIEHLPDGGIRYHGLRQCRSAVGAVRRYVRFDEVRSINSP